MDNIAKVSVVIPIYNDEKYIRHCVDSVINQTYENLEIILVNDNSKDKSLDICYEYESNDSRIKVINSTVNCGLSASREKGYKSSTGDWICFLDHDDCINKYSIEHLMKYNDDHTDIISGKYKNILNKDFEQYKWNCNCDENIDVVVLEHDEAVDTLGQFSKYEVPECLWGKIYRRELFEKIDILNYKEQFPLLYFEDVLLTSSLIKASNKIKIIDEYIYIHRVDYNSVSMSPNAIEFNLQTARTADVVIERLNENYSFNAYGKVIENYLLVFAKNWYLVWQYYNKDYELLCEMERYFDKYYKEYKSLKVNKAFVNKVCIEVFRMNKIVFCIFVCRLWFQCVSKVMYKLKSK